MCRPIYARASDTGVTDSALQDEMLIRMRSRNTPHAEIALVLGKSALACRLHMHNLGGRRKHENARNAIRHSRGDASAAQSGGPVVGSSAHFQHQFGADQIVPGLGTFQPMVPMPPTTQSAPGSSRGQQPSQRPLLPAAPGRSSVDERARIMTALQEATGNYWDRVASEIGMSGPQLREFYNGSILPGMSEPPLVPQRPSQATNNGYASHPYSSIAGPSTHRPQLPPPPQQHTPAAMPGWQNVTDYPARIKTLYVMPWEPTRRTHLLTTHSADESRLRSLGEAALQRSQAELENVSPRTRTAPSNAICGSRPHPSQPMSIDDPIPHVRPTHPAERDFDCFRNTEPSHSTRQTRSSDTTSLSPRTQPTPAQPRGPISIMGPPPSRVARGPASQPPVPHSIQVEAEAEADVRQELPQAALDLPRPNSAMSETKKAAEDARNDSMADRPRLSIANLTHPQ